MEIEKQENSIIIINASRHSANHSRIQICLRHFCVVWQYIIYRPSSASAAKHHQNPQTTNSSREDQKSANKSYCRTHSVARRESGNLFICSILLRDATL